MKGIDFSSRDTLEDAPPAHRLIAASRFYPEKINDAYKLF
jgi:hypothetical protein